MITPRLERERIPSNMCRVLPVEALRWITNTIVFDWRSRRDATRRKVYSTRGNGIQTQFVPAPLCFFGNVMQHTYPSCAFIYMKLTFSDVIEIHMCVGYIYKLSLWYTTCRRGDRDLFVLFPSAVRPWHLFLSHLHEQVNANTRINPLLGFLFLSFFFIPTVS